MTPKILISVSTYEVPAQSQAWVFGVRQGVVKLVNRLGFIPLFITPGMTQETIAHMYDEASGVMILGGHDIHPEHYSDNSEHPPTVEPDRDAFELEIMQWVFRDKKPFIGICRGMQLLNVARGGTLFQDIAAMCKNEAHGLGTANALEYGIPEPQITVAIEPETKLHTLVDTDTIKTLCNHHQAVDVLGDGLKVSARSTEGIVEVIEATDPEVFCFGIESHPEADEATQFTAVFDAFAQACRA